MNQTLNDLEKEKHHILEKLRDKENMVSEMLELKKKSQESEQEMQAIKQSLEQKYNEELRAKGKCIEDLSTELENLKVQISTKDDIIASLEHEISKQRGELFCQSNKIQTYSIIIFCKGRGGEKWDF